MDYKIVALIVGCYAAVIGSIYFTFTSYKDLSNHVSGKLDKLTGNFNDFRADVSGALGEIRGELNKFNKGGSDGESGA